MHRSIQSARIIQGIVGLALLLICQVAAAQSTPVEPVVPQWVIDRQQYEPTYVPPAEVLSPVPQWVIDRQQYETTFVLPQRGDVQPTEVMSVIPQWVIDRQQYETTYVPSQLGDIQPTQFVLQASG